MGLDHFYRIESIDDNKRYLLVESWIKIPLFLPTFIYLFSTISLLVMRIRCQGALIVFLPPAAAHRTKPLPKKLGKKVAKKKKDKRSMGKPQKADSNEMRSVLKYLP